MAKKSNKLISLMSLWGIILVVLGHSGFEEAVVLENLKGLHNYIYSYHMPLFFFISGFLFSLTNPDVNNIKYGKFVKKKFLRLYIPYLVLGLLIFGIKFSLSGLSHATRTFSVPDFLMMLIASHWQNSTMGYLWYIATLFFLFCLVAIICKAGINLKNTLTALIIVTICWCFYAFMPACTMQKLFNIGSISWYLPFFVIGVMYQVNEAKISRFILERGWLTVLFLFALTVGTLVLFPVLFDYVIVKIVLAMIGILFTMTFCNNLLKVRFCEKYLLPYGDITYTIYLMSFFGQYAVKVLFVNIMNLHWGWCVVGMFVAGLVFPVSVYRIYCKSKFLHNSMFFKLIIGV